jgi:hypothetical protein
MTRFPIRTRAAFGVAIAALLLVAPAGARAAAFGNASSHVVTADQAIAPLVSMHRVDMRTAPAAIYQPLRHAPGFMPELNGVNEQTWLALKHAAVHNPFAPVNAHPMIDDFNLTPFTPRKSSKFLGMADSASTCPYFGGCEPPDMAIAASSAWEVQGVNTSIAVYNTAGVLQPGWPKNVQTFFGVPNPGSCDPNGPFLSDPRALYDPTDGRFWVTFLQVEGAFGLNNCPEQTLYWTAVSQTSDPNGAWNVYTFNMAFGTTNAADYTQIGLDNQAFYFGANIFDQGGSQLLYDEVFAANKSAMEAGTATTPKGLKDIKIGTLLVDTLQPVMVEANGGPYPAAGLFIDSLNWNSGGFRCSGGCSGINLWAMANPLTHPKLTEFTVPTITYTLAPLATEPGCSQCIETLDTRLTGTPVYANGMISFSLDTGVKAGTNTVPGIFWGQASPTLTGMKMTGGTLVQSGLVSYTIDRDASFGAMMPDKNNNLFMVYDTMSSSINPGALYVARKSTDPLGSFGASKNLVKGTAASPDSRWGDYEAMSYEGPTTNRVWMASEFGASASDWNTFIASTHF